MTMYTHFDTSKQGAAFAAKNTPATVRGDLVDLIRSNPGADKEDLFSKFREMVAENVDYAEAVERYFFNNNYSSAITEIRQSEVSTDSAPAIATSMSRRLERQEAISGAVKKTVSQIALLFLTMPNGKAMRYCTGREMETFGKGYAKIAKKAGAKTVGEVLSEDDVRKLMDA